MLTGLCSQEELIHDLYYSARLARQSGIPFESHTLTDAPSHVWTVPTILAGAGIRYLSVGVNQTPAPLFRKNIHHKSPFWWVGPDGSKVLTWFSDGYSQAERPIGLKDGAEAHAGHAAWLPLLVGTTQRLSLRCGSLARRLRRQPGHRPEHGRNITQYHKPDAYPKVILAANNDFFEYIEKHFADKIQTVPAAAEAGGGRRGPTRWRRPSTAMPTGTRSRPRPRGRWRWR